MDPHGVEARARCEDLAPRCRPAEAGHAALVDSRAPRLPRHAQTALAQLNAGLDRIGLDVARIGERRAHYVRAHEARKQALASAEAKPAGDRLTAEYVTACVRAHVDADTIVLNEGITNYPVVVNHIAPTRAGQMLNSGGGNLGWTGGAAIGAKLAEPPRPSSP